jgi:flagellar hook-length control protein FliK
VDFPFNIDTKISGEDTGKPSNKAIGSDSSTPKLQFKEAYDSALTSDVAKLRGNSLPVARNEIAGISSPNRIALSKPGESQMMRLGDFDIEISGTSASLDDTVAFAQEIGLDRDLVETILLQSSTSGTKDTIASSDRLSSPIAFDVVPSNEMEDAADAIATLISEQLKSQISSNKDSGLSPGASDLGAVVSPVEIRSFIDNYLESQSNAGDNLNVEIALKKSDLAQSISAAIGASELFALGSLDRTVAASPQADQELKRVVLETLNLRPALDDVRHSLLMRAGQKNSPEIASQSSALIPELRQQTSQLTAASAKDFLKGVSQDPIAGRHFLSALNREPVVTRNTLDVISGRGVTGGLSEGDAGLSSKAREPELIVGAGIPVKATVKSEAYELTAGSKPGLDAVKATGKSEAYELAMGSKPSLDSLKATGKSEAYELAMGSKPSLDSLKATVKGQASPLSIDNQASSAVTNKGEPSGPRLNIDQVTPQVLRGSDLGASSAFSGGDLRPAQESVVGDVVKAGLKNSVMDEDGAPQKILRGGDLTSYVASNNNRIEPRLANNFEASSQPKSQNSVDSIKYQAARVDFEARGDLVKDESEFRHVGETDNRVTAKPPRVSGEFDQKLDPSLGAKEDSGTTLRRSSGANEVSGTRVSPSSGAQETAVQTFSESAGASKTESPKRDRPDVEGQFASSEINAKDRQSRVSQDRMPRSPKSSLTEDRVGTLRGLDLGSRVELASPTVAGPTKNSTNQPSKAAIAKTTDSLRVEPTKDFLMKRELSNPSITEHRVAPQSLDGGITSMGLPASSLTGFGIEPAISAAPTINSGLNLGERSAPLESGVLAKASGGQSPQNISTREMVGDNLSKLIGQRMLANVEAGNYRINFNLFPKDMGMVDITMELRDGRLDAQINASNAITRDLLGDTLPRLRDALNLSGFSESNIELGSDKHRDRGNNDSSETTGNGRDSDGKDLKDGTDGPKNIIVEDLHLDPDTVDLWA